VSATDAMTDLRMAQDRLDEAIGLAEKTGHVVRAQRLVIVRDFVVTAQERLSEVDE
jgi:hypothetical protein